ncbi:MAG: hypothetical protein WC587_01745 [Candidatus Paceibacterota bacterium]
MSWILIAVLAQVILGTSAVFDKLLLGRKFFNPLAYTFWLGVLGIFAAVLLPFGFQIVSLGVIVKAVFAGIFLILAMLFLFYGLDKGEASHILPAVGGISPIFTLIFGYFFLNIWLGAGELLAFFALIAAALILFLTDKKDTRKISLFLILASSFFFGISNVLSKIVFSAGNFITGFFWIKIGGLIFVLLFLFSGKIRKNIFDSSHQSPRRHRFLYFSNRLYAGVGSVLVSFAVSLSYIPALVDAFQGLKYVIIFIFAWVFLKEKFKGKILAGKIIATIFVSLGIILLALISYARNIPINDSRSITWGLTYSTKQAEGLGLDWRKTYEDILKELNPKKVRLVVYWDQVESEKGKFNFSETDWLLKKTEESGARTVLALGIKVPRWPEVHLPVWARNLTPEEREEALKNYLEKTIGRYKDNPAVEMWQIENEPYLRFGEKTERGKNFLEKEIEMAKKTDNSHPILITDGGEFGLWYKAAKAGDVFGTTMYRNTYTNILGWLFGNTEYPFSPGYFKLKEKIIRFLINNNEKKFIVIELQGEPWSNVGLNRLSHEEQVKLFSPDYFADTIKYAKETGFDEYYLWGAEWWYYMKEKYNDYYYWEYAKNLFGR